ncbi:protein NUCLEAR FUSION DEFECTIVE 6, chloroplastic/mitochondrial-like isoform X1 [Senna tora]|uniref:Protein NUCLEAR FUSION DEFECTIVE 6, chloroplastic/mitochondrial-like isoform X1 n=1 Tax=Senna tora TaxID=362788 RepID=A0A834X9P7_9FABA|nr:protein NUCLEAR FUSION DEFECTIVE 6, chloroplastic/mitochondrial-like isoform X1 [Senna tora]
MSVVAARTLLRSASSRAAATAKLSPGARARPTFSPFRIPKQNSLSNRIFRSPVEMSSCVDSMLPYHTATASALLTSMLSVSRRSCGWTPEGLGEGKRRLDEQQAPKILSLPVLGFEMGDYSCLVVPPCVAWISVKTLLDVVGGFLPMLDVKVQDLNVQASRTGYHA